jgi:hypothetical protein
MDKALVFGTKDGQVQILPGPYVMVAAHRHMDNFAIWVVALALKRRGSYNSPATRNRARDHLIAAAVYSQILYQLSYSRLATKYKTVLARHAWLHALGSKSFLHQKNNLTTGGGCDLYRKSDFPAYTIPEGAANDRYALAPIYHWPHGITVSTLDS